MNLHSNKAGWWLATLVVGLLALASLVGWAAEPEANPLLGTWSLLRTAQRNLTNTPVQLEWEFTKTEVAVHQAGASGEFSRNTYTVDLTKNPKWITVTITDRGREVRNGIFRIIGDELHLKQTIGGGPRPKAFGEDDFMVLKRARRPETKNQPLAPRPAAPARPNRF